LDSLGSKFSLFLTDRGGLRIPHSITGTKKEPASTISMDLPSPSSSVSLLHGKPNAQPAFLIILAEEILSTPTLACSSIGTSSRKPSFVETWPSVDIKPSFFLSFASKPRTLSYSKTILKKASCNAPN